MARPTLLETLPDREKILAANMYLRNENWETIFKYISLDDTLTAKEQIARLSQDLEQPMSDALYLAHLDLAQTEFIMAIAAESAEKNSTKHMTEYQKLAAHRIKIVNQIDSLLEKEEARGRIWEPSFDTESAEYKVFKAAITLFLELKDEEKSDFDALKPEEQARFYQILAESA